MANNKYKILLVEDDEHIRKLVTTILESSDYQVITANNCANALVMFKSYVPDLVLLDLGLPDKDGMLVIKEIRKTSLCAIVVLSARSDEKDKVLALDNGANDYITKPFGTQELLARIRSAIRINQYCHSDNQSINHKYQLRELCIDYDARRVFINEKEIKLTQNEYNIVAFLSKHSNKVMTYSAIIKAIWGYPDEGSIKKLQVNMANIRKKFGAKPGQVNYINNELGVGYRMGE